MHTKPADSDEIITHPGSALIGIFHDRIAREAVADRYLDMSAAAAQPEYVYVV